MSCFTLCFWRRKSSPTQQTVDTNADILSSVQNAKLCTFEELQTATGNFDPANKIGEGGFGSVFKGRLSDGTFVAIKILSAHSEQGVREFLNEIEAISRVEHENLVKLYGCCIEGPHRILIYEYLENNSIEQTLLRRDGDNPQFSWEIQSQICIGVAIGLAFLHEEMQPYIVHRDIKASNVLLDKDLKPKISDFGMAKIVPVAITHVYTRLAGTFGYWAPEYVSLGMLTPKADVYSFGILLLEIISGRQNVKAQEPTLLQKAWSLHDEDKLIDLVDNAVLEGDSCGDEACRYIKIGLLCTQDLPEHRPVMSVVAKMLKGEIDVNDERILKPHLLRQPTMVKSLSNELCASSSGLSHDKSSPSLSTNVTPGTMSFSSTLDRDELSENEEQ